jgi:hypothetical protein
MIHVLEVLQQLGAFRRVGGRPIGGQTKASKQPTGGQDAAIRGQEAASPGAAPRP